MHKERKHLAQKARNGKTEESVRPNYLLT